MVLPIPAPPVKRRSWLFSAVSHSAYCLLTRTHSHVPLTLSPLVRRMYSRSSSASARRRAWRHLSFSLEFSVGLITGRISSKIYEVKHIPLTAIIENSRTC
jgi:hypothetical protein